MKKNCLIVFAVLLGLFLSTATFSAPPEIAPGSSISDAQVWSPDKTEQSWPGSCGDTICDPGEEWWCPDCP